MNNTWLRYIMMCVVTLTLIAPLLGGCGGRVTEPRLVRADSLMDADPDSALALLLTIDSSRLDGRANQAYYALLLTQARYKCHIPATGDSLINIAVDYYRHHGDKQLLARSYLFKGAVCSRLGHNEEALRYYKEAENTVPDTSIFTKGYIEFRIAQLYQTLYISDSTAIIRYKQALDFFRRSTNCQSRHYQGACLGEIGCCYDMLGSDSAEIYLNESLAVCEEIGDTVNACRYMSKLSIIYYYSNRYKEAKTVSMKLIDQSVTDLDDYQFYDIAVSCLAREGKIDSARLVLAQKPYFGTALDSMNLCVDSAEIAQAQGDMLNYYRLSYQGLLISDSLEYQSMQSQLKDIEEKYDNQSLKLANAQLYARNSGLRLMVFALLAIVLLFIVLRQRAVNRLKTLQIEQKSIQLDLERIKIKNLELAENAKHLSQLTSSESTQLSGKPTANSQIEFSKAISHFIDNFISKIQIGDSPKHSDDSSKISLLNLFQKRRITMEDPGGTEWLQLTNTVNTHFNGIIDFFRNQQPALSKRDVRFLVLCCAGFPTKFIAICMGFDNIKSVSNHKNKLLHDKLGLKGTLEEIIERFLQEGA